MSIRSLAFFNGDPCVVDVTGWHRHRHHAGPPTGPTTRRTKSGDFYLATTGDSHMATSGDFFMATDTRA